MEQPLMQRMKVSISFIMYTEKSTLAYSKCWVIVTAHPCTQREAQKEGMQSY